MTCKPGFWSLRVILEHGIMQEVCGSEEILRGAVKEWLDGGLDTDIIEVSGMTNDKISTEHTIYIKRDQITGMSLMEVN